MDSDYLEHRAQEVTRLVEILKLTIDRRFPPDEAVDNALTAVKLESLLFVKAVEQFNKEN